MSLTFYNNPGSQGSDPMQNLGLCLQTFVQLDEQQNAEKAKTIEALTKLFTNITQSQKDLEDQISQQEAEINNLERLQKGSENSHMYEQQKNQKLILKLQLELQTGKSYDEANEDYKIASSVIESVEKPRCFSQIYQKKFNESHFMHRIYRGIAGSPGHGHLYRTIDKDLPPYFREFRDKNLAIVRSYQAIGK